MFDRWTPHPVIVIIRNSQDFFRVLLYSYYTSITGVGGPPKMFDTLFLTDLQNSTILSSKDLYPKGPSA